MKQNETPSLVKNPYVKTQFKTDKELQDFIKCCDPETGYLYFMDNFFMIQHPTRGSMVYHPWPYQKRLIETYHNYRFSISLMPRQSGKCFLGETGINIKNNTTGKQYALPIGIYYEFMQAQRDGTSGPDISQYEV
jgi:hypothetical protein